MARPAKPIEAIKQNNNVSHRTKREIAIRERAENGLLTGAPIEESDAVRLNISAHKAFERLIPRMEQIGKNDELYGEGARRYCLNTARAEKITATIEAMEADVELLDKPIDRAKVRDSILRQEQLLQRVQDALAKFENDNGMTVAASLRMIPKKPEKEENPFLQLMNG